jgi:hypothetical protein
LADADEGKGKPTRFALDLSADLLLAIGTVSAQWAALEYYLVRTTHACLERFANQPKKLSKNEPFNERRDAFIAAFMWSNVTVHLRQTGLDLAERIKVAENKRHKLIHGMASEDTNDHGEPLPHDYESVLIQRDHPKHFFTERMSVAQIRGVADEIADINADMFELYVSASLFD